MTGLPHLLSHFPLNLTDGSCVQSLRRVSTLHLHVHPVALGLATLLALHGFRKGSLSTSGSLAAFTVGYLTMANPFPLFGTMMIVFYLAGSRVTKVKADVKARLERESDDGAKHKSAKGGGRDMWQVLCNGLTGCVASVVFRAIHSGEVPRECRAQGFNIAVLGFNSAYEWKSGSAHCALSPALHAGWSRFLLIVALGHFACCAGDVFASELGILSKTKPFLLTSLPPRVVPPGTNGGVSMLGTLASAMGGLLIGMNFVISTFIWNVACRDNPAPTTSTILYLLALSVAAGLAGSMVSVTTGMVI